MTVRLLPCCTPWRTCSPGIDCPRKGGRPGRRPAAERPPDKRRPDQRHNDMARPRANPHAHGDPRPPRPQRPTAPAGHAGEHPTRAPDNPDPGRRATTQPTNQAIAWEQATPDLATAHPSRQPQLIARTHHAKPGRRRRRDKQKNTPRGTTPTQAGAANDALLRARLVKGDPFRGRLA